MKRQRTRIDDPVPNGRDRSGRFVAGNAAAKGRRSKRYRVEAAFACAVTDGDLEAIAEKLVSKAKHGDAQYARLVLEYRLGKPRVMSTRASIDLGDVTSGSGCASAAAKIAEAAGDGRLSIEQAKALAEVVSVAAEMHLARDLEAQVQALQEQVDTNSWDQAWRN